MHKVSFTLLVSHDQSLLLYHVVCPGFVHYEKQFERTMDEMFAILCDPFNTKERHIVVIDKGVNIEHNYTWNDEH